MIYLSTIKQEELVRRSGCSSDFFFASCIHYATCYGSFDDDFAKWAKWGKELMELHIGYETVKPYKLPLLAKLYRL